MSHSYRKTLFQVIIGILGILITLIVWKIIGVFISGKLTQEGLAILNSVAQVSLGIVPLLIMLLGKDNLIDYGITRQHIGKQFKVGVSIALCMVCILVLMPMIFGLKNIGYSGERYESVGSAIGGFLYFLLVVGPVEEFIFRGFLYGKLKEICLSDAAPIVISSLAFGVFHFSGGNVMQVIIASVIGAIYCWCMDNIPNCSLLSLTIAHGMYDWLIRVIASVV